MDAIFGGGLIVLAVLALLAGVVGLLWPAWLRDKKTGDIPSRKRIGLGMLGFVPVFVLGVVLFPAAPESGTEGAVGDSGPPTSTVAQQEQPKLNVSLDDWIQRMNAKLKEVDLPALTVSTEKAKCAEWCSTTYTSGKSVAYVASHRDGRIHELMMLASGDGTFQSGGQIMLGLFSMTHTLSTGLSKEEVSRRTMSLLKEVFDSGKSEATIGGVRYSASKIDGVGLFFSASK